MALDELLLKIYILLIMDSFCIHSDFVLFCFKMVLQ